MDPPRLPLNAMKPTSSNFNAANAQTIKPFFTSASGLLKSKPIQPQQQLLSQPPPPNNRLQVSSTPAAANSAKDKMLLPEEEIERFKREVEGSDLSKVGLIEVLKKKFPGRKAPVIKNTLEVVAKRMGSKEVDKRWVLLDDEH